jgi:hypothetical protein
MKKLTLATFMLGSLFAVSAFADEMTGVISDSHCGAAHSQASAQAKACVTKCVKGGSAPVFVSEGKVYKIDEESREKVMNHLGDKVTVEGEVDNDTLKIENIKAASE